MSNPEKAIGGSHACITCMAHVVAIMDLERELDDLQRLPAALKGFVPQTYGDAIRAGWIKHGDCPSHEWDNRTSAENARWMLERLLPVVCKWEQEQDYPVFYPACKESEEFHLGQGLDLYPHCPWCGGLVEVCSPNDAAGEPHGR